MPLPASIISILLLTAAADQPPIVVKAYPWAPFISPMGEPFRGGVAGGSPIARWFAQADRSKDGILTADEMQLDAERFFKRLDGNGDGQIDPDEIRVYEWEIAPDVQVNSGWKRPRGQAAAQMKPSKDDNSEPGTRTDSYDGYRTDRLQGAARYGLLNLPQPVASADADFNRAITLAEFKQAAAYRFKLLDGPGQGRITLTELEARLPARPEGKRKRPRKEPIDTRVGLPLPNGE